MKTAVVITLIVAGAFIVAIPPLSDGWRAMLQTHALEHGANLGLWEGSMGDNYRIGCWLLGAAMIGVGIKGALGASDPSRVKPPLFSATFSTAAGREQ